MANPCSQYQSSAEAGPWGAERGGQWDYKAPDNGGIVEIIIRYGAVVDSLAFISFENNNRTSSRNYGGVGGVHNEKRVTINYPGERLIAISGTCGMYEGNLVVSSLKFYTNWSEHGPYGHENDSSFEIPLDDQIIVGFYGREAKFLMAIGVHLKVSSRPIQIIEPIVGITMSMDFPREVGPWGGRKGKVWDDGVLASIDRIDVYVGNGVVQAIKCLYRNKDCKPVLSRNQGGGGATTVHRIKLEESTSCEQLVGIMGYYGPIDGNCCVEVVRSISFYTTSGKYGPYGTETGTFFSSPLSNAKVVGFHGRGSDYLEAIGVHVEYS